MNQAPAEYAFSVLKARVILWVSRIPWYQLENPYSVSFQRKHLLRSWEDRCCVRFLFGCCFEFIFQNVTFFQESSDTLNYDILGVVLPCPTHYLTTEISYPLFVVHFQSTIIVEKTVQDLLNLMHDLSAYSDQFLNMVCVKLQEYKDTCTAAYRYSFC